MSVGEAARGRGGRLSRVQTRRLWDAAHKPQMRNYGRARSGWERGWWVGWELGEGDEKK